MAIYRCAVCGYIYDESREELKWEDVPDDWECPVCDMPKDTFEKSDR